MGFPSEIAFPAAASVVSVTEALPDGVANPFDRRPFVALLLLREAAVRRRTPGARLRERGVTFFSTAEVLVAFTPRL